MNPKKNNIEIPEFSRIVIDVPKTQHRKFKALAAARGKSMKVIINEFICNWVKESTNEPTCALSHTPNAKTRKALENVETGRNITQVNNFEDLLKDLDN